MQMDNELQIMRRVHELAVEAFGRLASPLASGDVIQPIYLPGGAYATTVVPASPDTLAVRQALGPIDLDEPGIAMFLLREHSKWLYGRVEVIDHDLWIVHCLPVWDLSAQTLSRIVLAVHFSACQMEQLLKEAGLVMVGETADEEDAEG
jgi:hypothetical protein